MSGPPAFARDRWPDARDPQWQNEARKFWSDTAITASVKSRLAREQLRSLTKLDVETRQGLVELRGTVDAASAKERAGEVARQVNGVRRVVNNLRVQG